LKLWVGSIVRLKLWVTEDQERFHSLIPSYTRDSSVAFVVYDITNPGSFLNTSKWIEGVRAKRGSDVVIMLLGNKTNKSDERQVSVDEGEEHGKKENVLFIETSAKAGYNIKSLFRILATALPGMENQAITTQAQVDVLLKPVNTGENPNNESGCTCYLTSNPFFILNFKQISTLFRSFRERNVFSHGIAIYLPVFRLLITMAIETII